MKDRVSEYEIIEQGFEAFISNSFFTCKYNSIYFKIFSNIARR